jgi:hypothetical protein
MKLRPFFEFYDQEYYFNLEYRYLSGAIQSRNSNVLACIGPVEGKRVLELGCGGDFFANELTKRDARFRGWIMPWGNQLWPRPISRTRFEGSRAHTNRRCYLRPTTSTSSRCST